ncbi:MAG: TonB-dependent receptor [Bacteroidetes bacterium]|nr:TonB-dependent receptor [Bacteroidota bacterium]
MTAYLYPGRCIGQDYNQTIRGKVIDKQTRFPLAAANVYLVNSDPPVGASTDENGNFRIEKVPIGRQGIQVTYIGYNPATFSDLIVTTGKEVVLLVEMEERVYKGEEVVIVAEREKEKPLNEMAVVSARAFNLDETKRYAGSWGDPARMAMNFAGVGSASDQRNDIIIRGNSPMGVLWRLDGINIPNPNHFGLLGTTGGPVPILNSNLLDDSDFLSGAFPAEYGNALAGVFDVKMRSGNNEKREYVGQVGFNGFELGAEGPFSKAKRSSYIANYRYSTMGVFDALGINFGVSGIPEYQDISFKLDFPGVKNGRLTVFGMGGKSNIDLLDSDRDTNDWTFTHAGSDIYFYSDMGVAGISYIHLLSPSLHMRCSFAASGTSNSIREDSVSRADQSTTLDYRNRMSDVKYTGYWQLNKKFSAKDYLSSGIIADFFSSVYVDSARDNKVYIKLHDTKGESALIQAYSQLQHKFTDLIVLNAGIHYQYFSLSNESSVEPRAGIRWNFAENKFFNAGIGLHSQTQPLSSYYYETKYPDGTYKKTNETIKFTKSAQAVIGYDYTPFSNFRLKVESYYQYLFKVPVEPTKTSFSMLNVGGDFSLPDQDSLVNNGTGENYGVELTLEKFFSDHYYFLITGSFFESNYKGSDGVKRNTAFNGLKSVNILGGVEFKIGNKSFLELNGKTTLAGGKPYIPIDLEKSNLSESTVYAFDNAYRKRFDDYFRVDAEISYRLNAKRTTQEWIISVQNLTGNKNILTQVYDADAKEIRNEYQLGIFPVAQYRITF